jgi:L-malate glycosyltransferase
MMMSSKKIAAIVNLNLRFYRQEFFLGLKDALSDANIDLLLIYGKEKGVDSTFEIDIPWAVPVDTVTLGLGGKEIVWLQVPSHIYHADLIILNQYNRILNNYIILTRAFLTKQKTAFWGHGLNLEEQPWSLGNRFKRFYSKKVSWWFAYTHGTAERVAAMGFPSNRITIVENAIDTRYLAEESAKITMERINALKVEMGLGNGPIGIFCSRMYKEKEVDFLLASCQQIRNSLKDFEMIFIGDGPDSYKVKSFVQRHRWAHYLGAKLGVERIPYFKMADICLLPGIVGLLVTDCFALGVPLVTTNVMGHGPEIEYLIPDVNGIMTNHSIDAYVQGVVRVLSSHKLQNTLKDGCLESAKFYTVERMVTNFADGIIQALSQSR